MVRKVTPIVRGIVCGCLLGVNFATLSGCYSSDAMPTPDKKAADGGSGATAPKASAPKADVEKTEPRIRRQPVPDEFRPVANDGSLIDFDAKKVADELPVRYADGSPAYLPDGTPIDFRPRNIQRQMAGLPVLYVRNRAQQPLGIEGPAARPKVIYLPAGEEDRVELAGDTPNPRIDPGTGAICWLPFECTNTECPGRADGKPLMFAPAVPNLADDGDRSDSPAGDTGRPAHAADVSDFDLIRCPSCSKRDTLKRPVLPDTERRMAELQAELARLRSRN